MPRILLAMALAAVALAGAQAADDPITLLHENGTVKVLSLETEPCASESGFCLRVVAQCKLKRRASNWSKSLVKIVWYDPSGAAGFSAFQGFESCRGEAGDRVTFLFPLPPPGIGYSIELP